MAETGGPGERWVEPGCGACARHVEEIGVLRGRLAELQKQVASLRGYIEELENKEKEDG